jgi:hypothetical protein
MAFQKGQSGNPTGARAKPWSDAIRMALAQYETPTVKQGEALRAMAKKLIEKGLEGDKDAINEIGNRLDGKPAQAIEGTGDGGAIILKLASADETI